MSYKRTKSVNNIYEQMDRFLNAYKPKTLYLTTKQYNSLVEDQNKQLREEKKEPKWELPPYKGYQIKEYNP